jgi:hypothetical protein
VSEDIKSLALSVLRRHGVISAQSHAIEAGETRVRPSETERAPLSRCHSPECAGCYSVGTIDGRERFIHPPRTSEDWQEWLRKWQPPKGERPL